METAIVAATIGAVTSLIGVAVSFYFAIRKEREADWRKVKFEHYREFMSAASGVAGSNSDDDTSKRFAQACNTVQLIASSQVIAALQKLGDDNGNNQLLSNLIREIRVDLGMPPTSNPAALSFRLWKTGNKAES